MALMAAGPRRSGVGTGELASGWWCTRPCGSDQGREAQPGLLAGGPKLCEAVGLLRKEDPTWLNRCLADIADDYDLIVIDSRPGIWQLQDAGACVAGFVLIPTKVDDASIDGLAEVVDELTMIRERYNPSTEILGVVLTLVASRYVRVIAQARARLENLLGDSGVTVYEPVIRDTVVAGIESTRNKGRLAHEYEQVAANAPPWWKRLRKEANDDEPVSKAASGLAQDYQDLTDAVMVDFLQRLQRRRELTHHG